MRVFVYEYLSGGGDPRVAEARDRAAMGDALHTRDAQDMHDLLQAGRAMRDALVGELREACTQVSFACADVSEARALQSLAGDGVQPVWPQHGESAFDFVRRQAALHERSWIVAPETDGLLAQLAAVVEPSCWVGCSREALHLASRKRATIARLAAHGLCTPLAFDGQATHWIVKPDDGAGCVATVRHDRHETARADLQSRRVRGESATLEPWVEGQAMSVSLLCGAAVPGDVELLGIHHQSIALHAEGEGRARLHDDGVEIDREPRCGARADALRTMARAVMAAVPGLRGFVGVDLVWHAERGPVVIEINPRLTSAFVGLSAALGRSLTADVLNLPPPGPRTAPAGPRPMVAERAFAIS